MIDPRPADKDAGHARRVGGVDGVTESFYAISPERKLKHPAVVMITERAREHFLN